MVTLRSSMPSPSGDQLDIIDAYFREGRLCVDAGAGTGKTTTLVRILAQVVLDNFGKRQDANPLERVLAITFGVEASRDIKAKLRDAIKEHFEQGGPLVDGGQPPDSILQQEFWRFFETESNIQTIDALFMALLREIATFLNIPPTFDIPRAIDQDDLVDNVIETLRKQSSDFEMKWLRLEDRYTFETSFGSPSDIRNILWTVHQKMREFCWSPSDVRKKLLEGLDTIVHCGRAPPNSFGDITQILLALGGPSASIVAQDQAQVVSYARAAYDLNKQLITYFADLVEAFDAEYDKSSRQSGALTHTDIAYHVWKYSTDQANESWRSSLRNRFGHILIDEFQDTSYVQYSVLLGFISDNPPNKVVIIGDVKQSIYQWRSADPTIFADLIVESSNEKQSQGIGKLRYKALKTNFRSHPQLLRLFNGIFSGMFAQPQRGMIDGKVPYTPLKPPDGVRFSGGTRVHVLLNSGADMPTFVASEAQDLVTIVSGILGPGGLEVRDKKTLEPRPARPGDIGVLFRRNRYVQTYADAFRIAGLKVAVLTDSSLFSEPEISLIVDLFDWLANPDQRDPLLRVLRSPLVAMSDETLRYLASKSFILYLALDPWPTSLQVSEKKKLVELVGLRNDLRWDREGRKSELLERIIAFSAFDSVVLAGEDGLQAQANLWQLVEYVTALEEEELIGYGRFVEILKLLRDRAASGDERDYGRAIMALPRSEDTITIMTVHGAKGLEYPILVIAECASHVATRESSSQLIAHRTHGLLLKPQPPDAVQPFRISRPGEPPLPWVGWGEQAALLWVSSRREQSGPATGQLSRNSPIDSELRAEISEFWRLLYVAATRARDHLIFSIAANSNFRTDRWSAWMPYLRDAVGFIPGATGELPRPIGLTESGATVDISVGFNDLRRVQVTQKQKPPEVDWAKVKYAAPPRRIPSFLPRSVNPSNFLDLLECPRRYQYEALWQIAGARLSPISHGKIPNGRDPDDWGNDVHSMMEERRFNLKPEDDTWISDRLELNLSENRRSEYAKALALALKNFETSAVGVTVADVFKQGRQPLRELPFAYPLVVNGSPTIEVRGRIDLSFESVPGQWWVVDYKTEAKPPADSYLERMHRTQINAYAWALQKIYGYNVVKGTVAYVYPTFDCDEFVPDAQAFESGLVKALSSLEIEKDSKKGLIARPDLRPGQICSWCPYSGKKGGPCEHYN